MMELTLSRVTMMVCGVILLAAVVSPVSVMLNPETDDRMQAIADGVARMVDAFDRSGVDELTVELNNVIPLGTNIMFDGNIITLEFDDKSKRSHCRTTMEHAEFSSEDTICLTRSNGMIHFEKVW